MSKEINIKNRKASYNYELLEKFEAGIQLTGTEIKSIREGKASIAEAYCFFKKGELFIKSMTIQEYDAGSYTNHDPKRVRKLLLHRQELDKLQKKLQDQSMTIVPIRLYLSKGGYAKIQIALAKGKKQHDKRESLKRKDAKRQIDRALE